MSVDAPVGQDDAGVTPGSDATGGTGGADAPMAEPDAGGVGGADANAGGTGGTDASAAAPDVAGTGGVDAEPDVATATPDTSPDVGPDVEPPHGTAVVYAGGGQNVAIYSVDRVSGAFTFRGNVDTGGAARFAAIDRPGGHVVMHTTTGSEHLFTYRVHPAEDGLDLIDQLLVPYDNGFGGDAMQLSPTGKWVMVTGSTQQGYLQTSAAAIGADGMLGPLNSLGVQDLPVTWDKTGKCLFGFSQATTNPTVSQFHFDVDTGKLTPSTPPTSPISTMWSTSHYFTGAAIHPNGKWIYGFYTSGAGDIGLFDVDSTNCTVTQDTLPFFTRLLNEPVVWSSVVIHPSGRYLYAIGGTVGTPSTLAIDLYAIDGANGRLQLISRTKGDDAHRFTVGFTAGTLHVSEMLPELLIVGGKLQSDKTNPDAGIPPAIGITAYKVHQTDGVLTSAGDIAELPASYRNRVDFIFLGNSSP